MPVPIENNSNNFPFHQTTPTAESSAVSTETTTITSPMRRISSHEHVVQTSPTGHDCNDTDNDNENIEQSSMSGWVID